jgi:hypothetical protein
MMLTQIPFPVGSVHDKRETTAAGGLPAKTIPTRADIKTSSSHGRDGASVIKASKHVVECDAHIVLTVLHQGTSGPSLIVAVC